MLRCAGSHVSNWERCLLLMYIKDKRYTASQSGGTCHSSRRCSRDVLELSVFGVTRASGEKEHPTLLSSRANISPHRHHIWILTQAVSDNFWANAVCHLQNVTKLPVQLKTASQGYDNNLIRKSAECPGEIHSKGFSFNRVPPFQFYPTGMLWNKGLQQLASLGDVILCLYNHGPVDSERLRQQPKGKMLVLWLPGYSLHHERLDSKGKADRLCQAHLHCSLLSAFPPSVIRVSSAQTKPRRITCYALTRPFIYIMFFSDITWPWVQRKDFYLDRIPLLTRAGANPKFKAHSGRWV